MSFPPVSSLTEEYGQIEQQLQAELNAPRLQIRECYDISSAAASSRFSAFTESVPHANVVSFFLPTSSLPQPLSDIHTDGLSVDSTIGFRFTLTPPSIDRAQKEIELVRICVSLGNCVNHEPAVPVECENCPSLSDPPTSVALPPGFHSLCLVQSNEYVVFQSAQVTCTSLIRFTGGRNFDDFSTDNLCDICVKRRATIWCVNDSAKLCLACDDETHRRARIFEQHTKVKLPDDRPFIEFCPVHPGVLVERYCPRCGIPVCVSCRMSGSHARGEAASHDLVSIQSAHERMLDQTQNGIPAINRRRAAIEEALETDDNDLYDIVETARELSEQICRMRDTALKKVADIAGERALILRSNQTELLRKDAELDALDSLLASARKKSGPIGFLRICERQALALRNLETGGYLPRAPPPTALQLSGGLDVVETDEPRIPRRRPPAALPQTPPPSADLDAKSDASLLSDSKRKAPQTPTPTRESVTTPRSSAKGDRKSPRSSRHRRHAKPDPSPPAASKPEPEPETPVRRPDSGRGSRAGESGGSGRGSRPPSGRAEERPGSARAGESGGSGRGSRPQSGGAERPGSARSRGSGPESLPHDESEPHDPAEAKLDSEAGLRGDAASLSAGSFQDGEPAPSFDLISGAIGESFRRDDAGVQVISLEAFAARKTERARSRGIEPLHHPFRDSTILTRQQAAVLYACFPFRGQPHPRLLFATRRHGRSIQRCHELIDNIGITVVIAKVGPAIIGGFATTRWRTDGQPFGNGKNSFLFNMTVDALIPYEERAEDACHLWATPDCLTFGRRDLVFAGDFDNCTSELENSYAVGFERGSESAKTFLAGKERFAADSVEIWGFFILNAQLE